jgi:hypothetical protein
MLESVNCAPSHAWLASDLSRISADSDGAVRRLILRVVDPWL